jgi:hypothetical protein
LKLKSPFLFKFRNAFRPPFSYRCIRSVNYTSFAHSVGSFPAINSFLRLPNGSIPEPHKKPDREATSHRFFSHRTVPTLRRKKVSLRRRQQADTPNHCSTWHNPLKYFYGMPAVAMPFGLLWQVCHTACSSFAFVQAAPVSFTPFVHFFLRSASLHLVRSQTVCCKAGHPIIQTQLNTPGNAPSFRKPKLQYSPGFIPLHNVIHSLQ